MNNENIDLNNINREETWIDLADLLEQMVQDAIAVIPDDSSVEIQIKDGGLILVDKSITEFKNDGVYVIALDDALYVKRLQILPGRKLKVKSDNLNYDPFEVSLDTDNFHIVGKVIWAGALLECIK